VNGSRRSLNPLIRDQVYRIGREAVSNAFRHSGADKVEVEISYRPADLCLAVRDTGCGIDEEVLRRGRDGHWGLIGMRESAEKMGAELRLRSRAGAGTELDLRIPGHIAFSGTGSSNNAGWLPGWLWKRLKSENQAANGARDS
jgi:signal transduction histidine kinase